MKKRTRLLTLLAAAMFTAFLPGCGGPQDTLQTLQTEVSAYASNPSDDAAVKIEANFTRLDDQIAKLRQDGKTAEADKLSQQQGALQAQYAAARMTASLLKAKEAATGVGEAFRKAGEAFGEAFKEQPGKND